MDLVLTPREAAEQLRMSPTDLYPMLDRGEIPAFRHKGNWKIPVSLLKEYVEKKAIEEAKARSQGKGKTRRDVDM